MLTRHNCVFVYNEGFRILGNKGLSSRSLRRFLASYVADSKQFPGHSDVFQNLAFDEGFTALQQQALLAYAQDLQGRQSQELGEQAPTACFNDTLHDSMFGLVSNHYHLPGVVATASLKQLQEMVRAVVALAGYLVPLANNLNREALSECPAYVYRGHPCSIVPDDALWCVSGQDVQGGSGVLEWCYDEEDARQIVAAMQQAPQRFLNVEAHAWRAVQALAHAAGLAA